MRSIPYGELAALGTSVCWTMSTLAFSAAGQRLGSLALNIIRLVFAFVFLTAFCSIQRGLPLPTDASPHTWAWLSVSGAIGLILGDLCLFRAFALVGPRLSTLIMALVPPIAAVCGWLWLDERLSATDVAGMAVTLAGVAWVVLEQPPVAAAEPRTREATGIALAVLGALGQGVGLVLSKLGMGVYDPFAATQVRIIAGIVGFSLILSAVRWWPRVIAGARDRAGMGFAAIGAFLGPFVGVSLSLIAIQRTKTGVAATLMSLTPVFIIPAVMVAHREAVSPRAILGAVVAVSGVAILWLS